MGQVKVQDQPSADRRGSYARQEHTPDADVTRFEFLSGLREGRIVQFNPNGRLEGGTRMLSLLSQSEYGFRWVRGARPETTGYRAYGDLRASSVKMEHSMPRLGLNDTPKRKSKRDGAFR